MARRSVDEWVVHLQPELGYCYNCQPWDTGECIWILGRRQSMSDFLSAYGVPENLHQAVAEKLRCPNCGTDLDITADVAEKPPEERAADNRHHQWLRVWEPKLDDFVEWMERYPYLGLAHSVGQRIMNDLPQLPKRAFDRPET